MIYRIQTKYGILDYNTRQEAINASKSIREKIVHRQLMADDGLTQIGSWNNYGISLRREFQHLVP